MCQHHTGSPAGREFATFCTHLRRWLAGSPFLDPPLAAATELLHRRTSTWFECEVAHVAWNSEDMHSALGAGVVLSLWNASRTGQFTLPSASSDANI
jgi:hypothetical protein